MFFQIVGSDGSDAALLWRLLCAQMQKRPSRWQHFSVDPMQWGKPATYEHTKERCQQQQKASTCHIAFSLLYLYAFVDVVANMT